MEDDDHFEEFNAHAAARAKVKGLLNALENAIPSHGHDVDYAAQFTAARADADTALDAFAALFAP